MSRLADHCTRWTQRALGRPVLTSDRWQNACVLAWPSGLAGGILLVLISLGIVGLGWWSPDSALTALPVAGLLAAAFLVIAADERKRAKRTIINAFVLLLTIAAVLIAL